MAGLAAEFPYDRVPCLFARLKFPSKRAKPRDRHLLGRRPVQNESVRKLQATAIAQRAGAKCPRRGTRSIATKAEIKLNTSR